MVIGGVTRAATAYDLLGRVTGYAEYDASGAAVHSRYGLVYDPRGLVLAEKTATRQGSDWIYTHSVNHYSAAGTGGTPAAISWSGQVGTSSGSLLYYSETKNWKNGSGAPVYGAPGNYSQADLDYADSYTSQAYVWQDGAVQSYVQLINRDGTSTSSYDYDRDGALRQVHIGGGSRPRTISYTTDLQGQVLRRDEADQAYQSNDPHSRTYMFGGRQMGVVSNDGTGNRDYAAAIAERGTAPGSGAFRGGAATGTVFADFDANFTAFNGNTVSAGASSYTAGAGETLQSIAAQLWGDSALWYLLAEANGLSGSAALAAGTPLTIPGGVIGSHHNADTFKPYDPAEAIGNTSPNTPKPPSKKNCGALGAILVAVVSLAVTLVLPAAGWAARIGVGLLANAAGQGAAIATGLQDKFDFKGLAMAGITAGVTAGLDKAGAFNSLGIAGSSGAAKAAQAVLGSAVSQGIGVATGLRSQFDWAGVAAAGVGAYAGARFGGAGLGGRIQGIGADALASASTRSVLTGTDFGDNLIAVLPDVIARTLGAVAEDVITRRGRGDEGFFSQVPEQVNELTTSGAGVQAELAALVAGGPSLSLANIRTSPQRGSIVVAGSSGSGPDFYNPAEREPRNLAEVESDSRILEAANDQYRLAHNGQDYADYAHYAANIDGWRDYFLTIASPTGTTSGAGSVNSLSSLAGQFWGGFRDGALGFGSLIADAGLSTWGRTTMPGVAAAADSRWAERWRNLTLLNLVSPFAEAIDGAVLYNDYRPAARVMGGLTFDYAVGSAGRLGRIGRVDGVAAEGSLPIGIQFEGTVFRLENPSRINTTFDAHAGNVAANHRYSGPGQGAIYGATSPETALAEIQHYGLSVGRVSVSKEVQLGNVLDLTSSATRRELGVTLRDITGNSYTHTQRIGDWARVNGYDGILAPSARNSSGTNLIIFPGGK